MVLSKIFLPARYFFIGLWVSIDFFVNTIIKQALLSFLYVFQYLINGFIYLLNLLLSFIEKLIIYAQQGIVWFGKKIGLILIGLFKLIIKIISYLIKGFHQIILIVLYPFLKIFGKQLRRLFTFISQFFISLYKFGYKGLFSLGQVFCFILNPFYKLIRAPFDFFRNFNSEKVRSLARLPEILKIKIINWYQNLLLIKNKRAKQERKREALLLDINAEEAVKSEHKQLYYYVARNAEGKIEKRKIKGYSKLEVHSYLISLGYEVYKIELYKGLDINIGRGYKLKSGELIFFLVQLETYIKAGIPLVDAVNLLSKQTKKASLRDVYRALVYELMRGESFSEALAKQQHAFPKLLINMIKTAEMAGNLAEVLDSMVDHYTTLHKVRKQMITAMMYPTVIFGFAIIIVIFIMVFVIPEFISIYEDLGSDIPAITLFTISLSKFLVNNYFYVIAGIIGVVVLFFIIYKNIKTFRFLIQWFLMHMPVVGKIIIYNEVTMFAKTFGSLLKHNVFIPETMEILSRITDNEIYKMLIYETVNNLSRGEPISKAFKNHWAFPIVAYEMLVTGERTGQPGPMMEKVANYYQEEHNNAISQVKVFIEPVMIIFLAVVVGFILLSVVLPMFSIYGSFDFETDYEEVLE